MIATLPPIGSDDLAHSHTFILKNTQPEVTQLRWRSRKKHVELSCQSTRPIVWTRLFVINCTFQQCERVFFGSLFCESSNRSRICWVVLSTRSHSGRKHLHSKPADCERLTHFILNSFTAPFHCLCLEMRTTLFLLHAISCFCLVSATLSKKDAKKSHKAADAEVSITSGVYLEISVSCVLQVKQALVCLPDISLGLPDCPESGRSPLCSTCHVCSHEYYCYLSLKCSVNFDLTV